MNPWNVESLEEFLYFCCPECDLKDQSKVNFLQHALEHHPKAKECVLQFNEFIIKEEPCEDNHVVDENINNENFYNVDENYGDMLECELKYEHNEDTIKNEVGSENATQPIEKIKLKKSKPKEQQQKSFQCDVCVKSFHKECYLETHKKKVHGVINKQTCEFCNKDFEKKSKLELICDHFHLHCWPQFLFVL